MHKPTSSTTSTSTLTLTSSLLLALLPLTLLLPSFILSTYSSTSKSWTYRHVYDPNNPSVLKGTTHRSPWRNCALSGQVFPFIEDCQWIRSPSGLCDGSSEGAKGDNAHFCQQLGLSARLLYAGDAMIAAAFILVLILSAVTLPQILRNRGSYTPSLNPRYQAVAAIHHGHSHGHQHTSASIVRRPALHSQTAYLSLLLRLLSILGGLLLLLGSIIAANTLVNIQFPIGDWYSTGDPNSTDLVGQDAVGPWLMGSAVGPCVAAAVLAGVAGALVGRVWEGPRVGVLDVVEGNDGENGNGNGREGLEGGEGRSGERVEELV
jgi:hypothetical protein